MKTWEVPQIEAWGEVNKTKALTFCTLLNDVLAEQPFIVGSQFSVSDITTIVALDFMKPARIIVPESMTHLIAYAKRMRARQSMQ